jgi:tagatose-1,6-bisphosphate aldolase non-catalytic subunit AgaZ/GatZ
VFDAHGRERQLAGSDAVQVDPLHIEKVGEAFAWGVRLSLRRIHHAVIKLLFAQTAEEVVDDLMLRPPQCIEDAYLGILDGTDVKCHCGLRGCVQDWRPQQAPKPL